MMHPTTPPAASKGVVLLESPRCAQSFPLPHHAEHHEVLTATDQKKASIYRKWLELGIPFDEVYQFMKDNNHGFVSRKMLEQVIDGNVDYYFPDEANEEEGWPTVPLVDHPPLSPRASEMSEHDCIEIAAAVYRRMLIEGVSPEMVLWRMQQDGVADNPTLVKSVCNVLGK